MLSEAVDRIRADDPIHAPISDDFPAPSLAAVTDPVTHALHSAIQWRNGAWMWVRVEGAFGVGVGVEVEVEVGVGIRAFGEVEVGVGV